MQIRLEHKGTAIHEIEAGDLREEVSIGRSRTCTWRVPVDEATVGSCHLTVSRRGRRVYVTDLQSKNGTWFRGKRLKKRHCLRPGDTLTFGACTLSASPGDACASSRGIPQVTVLNGPSRGAILVLPRGQFVLGSSPDAGLCLLDDLVSRHHAVIELKEDGYCYIKDTKSTNGTAVNGAPLRSGQERMLKNEDVISLAQFEIRFYAGKPTRPGWKLLLQIFVLLATLGVVLGALHLKNRVRPSADELVERARLLAAGGDFGAATNALEQAETARHAQLRQNDIQELRRNIELWENTWRQWQRVCGSLAATNNLAEDAGILSELCGRPALAWSWSPTNGPVAGEEAVRLKKALDAILRTRSLLDGEESGEPRFTEVQTDLNRATATLADSGGRWTNLLALARTCGERLNGVAVDAAALEKSLNGLRHWPPDLAGALKAVQSAAGSSNKALSRRAEGLRPAVQALSACMERLGAQIQAAGRLQFEQMATNRLNLPSAGALSLDSRLSEAARSLERSWNNLLEHAAGLQVRVRAMEQAVTDMGAQPSLSALWAGPALEEVFRCDTLEKTHSNRVQDRPIGEYDRFVGAKELVAWLDAMRLEPGARYRAEAGEYVPLLQRSLALVAAAAGVRDYLDGLEREGNGYLKRDAAAEKYAKACAVLGERDALVSAMAARAAKARGREAIVAGAVACLLAGDRGQLARDGHSVREDLSEAVNGMNKAIRALNEQYDPTAFEKAMAVRREILELGLPGNKIVNMMWREQSDNGKPATPPAAVGK